MSDSLIALWGVRVVRAGRVVLEVPHFGIHRGETVAILGRNGAGKSTMLQILGLLTQPDAGQVLYSGRPVAARERLALRRRMAAVFQDPLLLDRTVERNVALGLELRGCARSEIARRVGVWLERFDITALARRPARELSGGEAQRVSLARALVLEPELLLLDEPFAALDAPTRFEWIESFGALIFGPQRATVLVTHDAREAIALAHRIAVLERGRIVQVGSVAELLNRPASAEVEALVRPALWNTARVPPDQLGAQAAGSVERGR
ncbi:MAG TPA: ATP-binding cassette domain-containing protein [Acidobacteriota bacterium]